MVRPNNEMQGVKEPGLNSLKEAAHALTLPRTEMSRAFKWNREEYLRQKGLRLDV